MRMSRGPSAIKLNPLRASSNCRLLTPKSASKPSTEAGSTCSAMELNASPINVTCGAWLPNSLANPVQLRLGQLQRLGVPVESDQVPLRAQPPDNSCRMTRQAQRAVHYVPPGAHTEKINRFF